VYIIQCSGTLEFTKRVGMAFEGMFQMLKGDLPEQRSEDASQTDSMDTKLPTECDDNVLMASATAQQKKFDATNVTPNDEGGNSEPSGQNERSASLDWSEFESVFAHGKCAM
jgi:hypothetical protein